MPETRGPGDLAEDFFEQAPARPARKPASPPTSAPPAASSPSISRASALFAPAATGSTADAELIAQRSRAPEFKALLVAYQGLLDGAGGMAEFQRAYGPDFVTTGPGETLRPTVGDEEGPFWFIPLDDRPSLGLLLPSDGPIQQWGELYQFGGGTRAQSVFGRAFEVEPGNVLQVMEPAWIRFDGDTIRLEKRGGCAGPEVCGTANLRCQRPGRLLRRREFRGVGWDGPAERRARCPETVGDVCFGIASSLRTRCLTGGCRPGMEGPPPPRTSDALSALPTWPPAGRSEPCEPDPVNSVGSLPYALCAGRPEGRLTEGPNAHPAGVRCLRPFLFGEAPCSRRRPMLGRQTRVAGTTPPAHLVPAATSRKALRPSRRRDGEDYGARASYGGDRSLVVSGLWSGIRGLADLFVRVGGELSADGRCLEGFPLSSPAEARRKATGRDDPSPPRLPVRPQG